MGICSISLHPLSCPHPWWSPAPIFGVQSPRASRARRPPKAQLLLLGGRASPAAGGRSRGRAELFLPSPSKRLPGNVCRCETASGEGQSCPCTLGRGQMAPRGQLGLEMKEKQEEEEGDTRAGCSLTSSRAQLGCRRQLLLRAPRGWR